MELVKSIEVGKRTLRQYRTGEMELRGGIEVLRGEEAVTKLNKYVLESRLDDEQIADILQAFPVYKVGKAYEIDDLFRYENQLWKVVQAHTSQSGWLPDATPALYTEAVAEGVIPVWVQPTGAHDAYAKGDQVEHPADSGEIWESTIDANTTEPGTLTQWGYWVEVLK